VIDADSTVLEIRTYRLKPGTADDFHRVVTATVPLLRQYGITVVRWGPSERAEDGHDEYVLIRSFDSVESRDEQEERFYGGADWRDGPRNDVLSRIETYHTIVLSVPGDAVTALART